ncbi:hypothetical protein GCM10012275_33470 [Longimycelium tulufanense]|uniref:NlpC/P60 domain-containing protein n=1 Tax=Longimycelium tulufanense TaxID=907463 RepID=A0A8J3C9F1_9PSEU|nr:C40 family peptidase [Longimycelium tulufanense]GGM59676.1 hypothetical protein GCM10012275_33470 [Longimycelium tulufanense]
MGFDITGLVEGLVGPMRDHLAKLDGDTGSAGAAGEALGRAATALRDLRGQHTGSANAALNGWYGEKATEFHDRIGTFDGVMDRLASNCATMQTVAGTALDAVSGGRSSIQKLIDEYVGWVSAFLQAAVASSGANDPGAVLRACGVAKIVADEYASRTAGELQKVRDQLIPLVARLNALQPREPVALDGLGGAIGANPEGNNAHGGTSSATSPGGHPTSGGEQTGGGATGVRPDLPMAVPPQPGSGVEISLPGGVVVEAPNEVAAAAVRNALSALGTPYVWGGSNPPQGTDCSGLTKWAYGNAGLELPRLAQEQTVGARVPSADQLLPGDLLVWSGHVAMYVGNGQLIEAGDPVQIGPVRTTNAGQALLGFFRPTG